MPTIPELGIIEGFYGRSWTWDERRTVSSVLAPHGFGFYLYAPKGDAHLRRRWRDPYPAEGVAELARFARHCRLQGVRFGIGLSPYEIFLGFDEAARAALAERLALFDELGIEDLALLFDDMRGDLPDLAERQIEVIQFAREVSEASRLIVCPSYYSDDPVLDRVFGMRPAGYLETLGRRLDPNIEIFWTGPEVCSRELSPGHLRRVSDQLQRKPFLWDNYPVNDGPRMSQHLHLRGFTGRPASIAPHIAAHAINPALQPRLSCIPALTLAASYAQGDGYDYAEAFHAAAVEIVGIQLARTIRDDLLTLQDGGLARIGDRRDKLRDRYERFDHPSAREIVEWLDGLYDVSSEEVETQ
jgi:hypothetical protein